jgi:radical SAM superfamily enzyme YgiQ (UPF0313 family)
MVIEKKLKLLLISPKQQYMGYTAYSELAKMFGKKRLMIPLALPMVAAYTPDNYDIRIVDEETENLPLKYKPDIVGITTLAATKERAFEVGDIYRKQGVKVIMGGINASVLPEEYLEHADCVVIGEAENAWEQCLEDFEKGKLQKIYKAEERCDYVAPKPPRWDLVNMKNIFQVAVQITRGCPFNCDFCLVSNMFGRKMRFRDIDNVVKEIKSLPSKYIFFVDDNLTINKKYAHELMKRLMPLGISWACMASIDVAEDEILLKEMAEAGCFNILIGFESLNADSLDETHKAHNRGGEKYAESISKIHAAGIHINASFIVGFDNDTLSEFDRIFDFSMKSAMPNVNLHLLTAPAGTVLHNKLKGQGRLFPVSANAGVGFFPMIHYCHMGQMELFDKYMETIQRLFSFDTILEKAKNLFSQGSFTKPGGRVSFLIKLRLSGIIIKEFIFTSDKNKKELFRFFFHLIREKKIAIDRAFSFMTSMLSSHRQVKSNSQNIEQYRSIIRKNDIGPWENVIEKQRTNA